MKRAEAVVVDRFGSHHPIVIKERQMATSDSIPLPQNVKDETGNVYGKLTVIAFSGLRSKYAYWSCHCECGNEVDARGTGLRYGSHQSCGCSYYKANGLYHTAEHRAWSGLIQRCTNPKNPRFSEWGGRGISVCDRWRNSFLDFYEDMGPKPSPKHSIDRINNDGNYEPSNCRWATPRQQTLNSRHARYLTHNGETLCLADWARRTGIKRHTIAARLDKQGWSIAEALTHSASPIARCHRS